MKLKKIIICFLFFIITAGAFTQSNFSFGLNSSYLNNYRIITNSKSDVIKDKRNSIEIPMPGFDIEAVIYFKIQEKLFIETGAGYSKTGYATKEEQLIDPGFSPVTAPYYSEIYRFPFNNIYIPAHIVYLTKKKLNYSIIFGPSILFPISKNIEWILRKKFGSSTDEMKIVTANPNIKNINLTLDLGFGIGYRFSEKFNLILQPKLIYYLLGNGNSMMKDHLISYGLSFKLIHGLNK
jgi:hypothetical protein